ncbi:MAG TPA: PIG-L family deacetylase [Acidimicrobiales bacterium]|jgi:LmbE family N-acetylglucosaminyl deacetylase|nr:PIG-L family deacetylase [Acidimicrobiales bacterium]
MDVRTLGTILGVWAHPDDEAYLSAGLMAMATRAGSRVVCVTATRGELGSTDIDRWPLDTLAEVRTVEMAASLDILGVTEHHWLDYPDGACAHIPEGNAIGRLAELISSVQPDTVVTFGPDGMTGHLDHQTVSDWTTKAFVQAADPGARLYYATKTAEFDDRFTPVPAHRMAFGEGPPRTPEVETDLAFRLSDEILDLKVGALQAQVSQVTFLYEEMGADLYRDWVGDEWFCLAATA